MGKRRLNVHERSDRELIAGGLEGKLYFREALYKRYFSYAMSIAVRYAGDRNEAIEVVNDSFMKVLDKLGDYNVDKPFKSWYGRIVVNTAIDGFRKKKKDDILMSSDNTVYEDTKDPDIEMKLTVNDILALFSHLPEIYKLTFNLYEIEGYDHKEIGQMLGVSSSTSRSNLSRAKKMLRQLYNKHINSMDKDNEAV